MIMYKCHFRKYIVLTQCKDSKMLDKDGINEFADEVRDSQELVNKIKTWKKIIQINLELS